MRKVKNSKLLLKILSGIIAVVLWFAITYTEDPAISQTLSGVTLEIKGESTLNANGFAIVKKSDLPAISVIIRGSRSNVISALGDIHATIDVSSIKQAGTNLLPVTYSYPSGRVVLEKAKTKEIQVETETLISREIPVKTEVVNRDKNSDYIIKSVCPSEYVTISGAENTVYKIAYARVKVDAAKISKSSTQDCLYDLCTERGEIVSEENIVRKSSATLSIENTVYERITLPIKAVLDADARDAFGIIVKNIEEDTVDAGLDDGVTVEFIEAVLTPKKGETSYEATLSVPDGVYIPEENLTVKVTGEILPKQLREITVPIKMINVPEGKNFTVTPSEKSISLEFVGNIDDIDLKATVDVGKMTASEENLPIEISTDADVEIIGTYSVTVKEAGE